MPMYCLQGLKWYCFNLHIRYILYALYACILTVLELNERILHAFMQSLKTKHVESHAIAIQFTIKILLLVGCCLCLLLHVVRMISFEQSCTFAELLFVIVHTKIHVST